MTTDYAPWVGRVLFLGRATTADQFEAILRSIPDAAQPGLDLERLTNQKSVLAAMRHDPPRAMFFEVDAAPDSRVRLGETVRARLPQAALYAVGVEPPRGRFRFDGFLRVPFAREEVTQTLAELLHAPGDRVLQRGPLRLDVAARTVITPNGQHHMTPKQCALLRLLMAHRDEVVSRRAIMQTIWETSYMDDTRTLDVHIRWLREFIEPDPSNPVYLLTVRGLGYRLDLP
jgi:hypothetical protein